MSALGRPQPRLEGVDKVTGVARYAVEHPADHLAHVWAVHSTVAKGTLTAIEESGAAAVPGVLAVLTHRNAPRLGEVADGELSLLQSPQVAYRGQFVAAVVAESLEAARRGAQLLRIDYAGEPHDVVLTADHPGLYTPETVNPTFPAVTDQGDVAAALDAAATGVDVLYRTPAFHNSPMEAHAATASWDGETLTVYDSTQGTTSVAEALAALFGLDRRAVRVLAPHVGGGFGSKGSARPHVVIAAMAARLAGRPVRFALTRQAMFAVVGYRTPTIQRVRLGADAQGRIAAVSHDATEQSSTLVEFAEQTAVATRHMYAGAHRHTGHRLARLDVPTPRWMRAPGECPGMYALESAMDELAVAAGLDPIELRVRNEPAVDPETGEPFSSRQLVDCLRQGADRFGWAPRDPTPRARQDDRWLVGTGVAASIYPALARPSGARARWDGTAYHVGVNATDVGTGARTLMWQVALDALGAPAEQVHLDIADSSLPAAPVAGGSAGTASWGWAVDKACRALREQLGRSDGAGPAEVTVDTAAEIEAMAPLSRHAFGAQFAEVRVDVHTGEIRVARMTGVFAAGRILNPRTARSQFLGGMTMGLSMALLEDGVMDAGFGDYVNADLASYHVAASADVPDIDVSWLAEEDGQLGPLASKGIGEIGIVGTAAAVGNAVYHATGVRVRELPIRLDALLGR